MYIPSVVLPHLRVGMIPHVAVEVVHRQQRIDVEWSLHVCERPWRLVYFPDGMFRVYRVVYGLYIKWFFMVLWFQGFNRFLGIDARNGACVKT